MITKSKAFTTSDGNQYATLEIAQRAEMLKLLTADGEGIGEEHTNPVLHVIFKHLDEVKDIFRATGRKQRKAKANGAKRTRKTAGAKEVV